VNLFIKSLSHGRLENDVERPPGHVGKQIEDRSSKVRIDRKNVGAGVRLSVENFERIFQNFEVKRGSQEFATVPPFFVSALKS
jgi:hypothetical protein